MSGPNPTAQFLSPAAVPVIGPDGQVASIAEVDINVEELVALLPEEAIRDILADADVPLEEGQALDPETLSREAIQALQAALKELNDSFAAAMPSTGWRASDATRTFAFDPLQFRTAETEPEAIRTADIGRDDGGVKAADRAFPVADGGGATGQHSALLSLPNDTLFSSQWHLNQTGAGLFDLGDLSTIWDEYTGAGVEVAVIDDSVQRTHHQLDDNYSIVKDWDFVNNDTDPSGVNGDNHGTAVAGIIGAARDGVGTVGVAYDATMFGFAIGPFINDFFIDTMIASISSAGGYAAGAGYLSGREADIANMSLGTQYSGNYFDLALTTSKMNDLAAAIQGAVDGGRGGLGTILVKSAGNSRGIDNDANASSWNANYQTISVAAVDQDGSVSSYSSHGANILISAFGSPLAGQVVTTDRLGSEGYNTSGSNQDYTFGFNGTSAAAPMVSGVVALMLDANPGLGWRDVQEILAYSARHVGSNIDDVSLAGSEEYPWDWNGAGNWNGGGLHFSNDYGFGLIDAYAAVRMAEVWTAIEGGAKTSSNDALEREDLVNSAITLAGFNTATSFSFTPTSNIQIEHVKVEVLFSQWDDLGDLDIVLIAPDGTEIHIIDNIGENDGSSAGGFGSGRWEFSTPGFMGMTASGTWTVELRDSDSESVSPITITDLDIEFWGSPANTDDAHFVFTDEYSQYDGVAGHGTNFAGGSTGVDTINAVAVTSDTVINLLTNSGTIDGVAISNSHIERVYTGDGDDTITGDSFSTYLDAGRGNDSITGGAADESLFGRAGNDILDGGNGTNFSFGGDGNDTFIGGNAGDDNMYGEDGNDTFRYTGGVAGNEQEFASGGAGSDRLQFFTAGIYDFTSGGASTGFNVSSIEEIEFFADGQNSDKTVILSDREFVGGAQFADGLLIDGNASGGSDDTIRITMNFGTTLDISDWTFQNWFSESANDDNVDRIYVDGSTSADTITTTSEDDIIDGQQGNDTILAGAGNDTMIMILGGGADSFNGQAGVDTVDFTDLSSGFNMDIDLGADTYAYVSGGTTYDLISVENVIGSQGNDTIRGEFGATSLNGWSGDDTIEMGDASIDGDVFDGGVGSNDTFDVSEYNWGTAVTIDLTAETWSYFAGSEVVRNFENILGAGGVGEVLNGNNLVNTIEGNGGNDTINGNGGRDAVNGGSGNDLMIYESGEGFDDFDGGTGVDTVELEFGANMVMDLINEVYYTAPTSQFDLISVENVTMTGTGNDTLIGNGSGNVLIGGLGNDVLNGRVGGDVLNGGGGIDTASYADDVVGVRVRLFNGFTAGGEAAGDTLIGIENLIGGSAYDILAGNGQQNVLSGNGGGDLLSGGGNSDVLNGGAGDDTLEGGADADVLNGGADNDTLQYKADTAGVSIKLFNGTATGGHATGDTFTSIENVTGGFGFDSLAGDGGDNVLDGRNAKDELSGGNGNDTLIGQGGFDVLIGGNGADELNGGNGRDTASYVNDTVGVTVRLFNGFTAGGEAAGDTLIDIENLTGGSGNDTLIGDGGKNILIGGRGGDVIRGGDDNDQLHGEGGWDEINGGRGNDQIYGGAGNDTLVFSSNWDADTVYDFDLGNDTAVIEGGYSASDFTLSAGGGGTTATLVPTGDSILFIGLTVADLNGFNDFVFV